MTAADTVSTVIASLGGVGAITAGLRWWLDRAERIRREDRAREDAQRASERESAEKLGKALAESAAATTRLADAVEDIGQRMVRIEDRVAARDTTGEHRAGGPT